MYEMSTLQSPMSTPALKYSGITYLVLSALYLKVHWALQAASTAPAEVWLHQSTFTALYPFILSGIGQADAKGSGVAFQLEAGTEFHQLNATLHYPGIVPLRLRCKYVLYFVHLSPFSSLLF